ncbi:MAG: hypothetical protein EB025_02855 [Chitinophagaceae bacterium]|jgi:hypothetical protein|nr:hypothetical protein [Chitinophagaceae bacterium]NDB53000.1 hypothetical protein [Chitinophagaceae bacterium]HAL95531.1 hypothetical protein [Chitinophagaceae bacterium]
MKHEVSKKVDQLISSLDQVKRAPAPAFFYTRLRARMDHNSVAPLLGVQLRPALALFIMLLLFLVNTILVINRTPTPTLADVTDKEESQHWSNEYAANDQFPFNESYANWASNK